MEPKPQPENPENNPTTEGLQLPNVGAVITPTSAPRSQSPPPSQLPPIQLTTSTPPPEITQPVETAPKKRFPRKLVALVAGAAVLLVGGSAGAYFGYYVPNKPENLWGSSLANTGKGYDKVTDYTKSVATQKGYKFKASYKVSGSFASDGTVEGSSDGNNGRLNGDISAVGVKTSFQVLSFKSSGSNPDVYLKVDGLQGIGPLLGADDPALSAEIEKLNGQWYMIDHTLFDQYTKTDNKDSSFTADDFNATLKAIEGPTKKYVFTSDTKNMVFVIKQKIGKEKQDGASVYHYKVGVNKANAKAYNNELCTSLEKTKAFKILDGTSDSTQAMKDCKDTSDIDKWDESSVADVWVDTHTRLIHKVRFSDKTNKENYFDIGQDYKGGTKIPFILGFHQKEDKDVMEGALNIDLDTSTNEIVLKGTAKSTGSSAVNASFDMTFSPNNTPLSIQKPVNAKNFLELLNSLGYPTDLSAFGLGTISGSATASGRDAERKTDLRVLESKVAEYYALNGYYPATLSQISDLPAEACKAPNGSGTCAKPDYLYKAFKAGTKPSVTAASNCNNKPVKCDGFIIYTPNSGAGAMEAIPNPYSVDSNFGTIQ